MIAVKLHCPGNMGCHSSMSHKDIPESCFDGP